MNPDNPYKTPECPSDVLVTSETREKLRRIARSQHHVNLAVLLYLAVIPIMMAVNAIFTDPAWISSLLGLYILGVIFFGAFATYRLTSLIKGHFIAVLYMIGLLIPLLGLLLLLSINGEATKIFKKAGIKVGLLGADVKSI